jgi:hypothetical protein
VASTTSGQQIQIRSQQDQIDELQNQMAVQQGQIGELQAALNPSPSQGEGQGVRSLSDLIASTTEIALQISEIKADLMATTSAIGTDSTNGNVGTPAAGIGSATGQAGKPNVLDRVLAFLKTVGLEINQGFVRITKLFVGDLQIEGQVCVDDTCVTKDQFKEMILRSGVGATIYSANISQIMTASNSNSNSTSTSAEGNATTTNLDTPAAGQSSTGQAENATTTEIISAPAPEISAPAAPSPSQGEGVGDEVEVVSETVSVPN